jgi:hypothetical protein
MRDEKSSVSAYDSSMTLSICSYLGDRTRYLVKGGIYVPALPFFLLWFWDGSKTREGGQRLDYISIYYV